MPLWEGKTSVNGYAGRPAARENRGNAPSNAAPATLVEALLRNCRRETPSFGVVRRILEREGRNATSPDRIRKKVVRPVVPYPQRLSASPFRGLLRCRVAERLRGLHPRGDLRLRKP
jgi:hypothetical protein